MFGQLQPAAVSIMCFWAFSLILLQTVQHILKLLNLNVLNFTVVLKFCEGVVVSAWDCLVPGWITLVIIVLFCCVFGWTDSTKMLKFEEKLLRRCCVCKDVARRRKYSFLCLQMQNSKLGATIRTVAYYLFTSDMDMWYINKAELNWFLLD